MTRSEYLKKRNKALIAFRAAEREFLADARQRVKDFCDKWKVRFVSEMGVLFFVAPNGEHIDEDKGTAEGWSSPRGFNPSFKAIMRDLYDEIDDWMEHGVGYRLNDYTPNIYIPFKKR